MKNLYFTTPFLIFPFVSEKTFMNFKQSTPLTNQLSFAVTPFKGYSAP